MKVHEKEGHRLSLGARELREELQRFAKDLREDLQNVAKDTLRNEVSALGNKLEAALELKFVSVASNGSLQEGSSRRRITTGRVTSDDSTRSIKRGSTTVSSQPSSIRRSYEASGSIPRRQSSRERHQEIERTRSKRISASSAADSMLVEKVRRDTEEIRSSQGWREEVVASDSEEQRDATPIRQFPKHRGATSTCVLKASQNAMVKQESEPLILQAPSDDSPIIRTPHRHRMSWWVGSVILPHGIYGAKSRSSRNSLKSRVQFDDSIDLLYEDANVEGDGDIAEERSMWENIVENNAFTSAIAWLLLLNMLSIALETDYLARNWSMDSPFWFKIIEATFCLCFVIEIFLRTMAYGCVHFCDCGNLFDLLMVAAQVFETVMSFFATLSLHAAVQFRMLRIIRIVRMFRAIRLFRVIQQVNELKLLLGSMVETVRPLMWMLLLLTMTSAMFAMFLTQIATEHKISSRGEGGEEGEHSELEEFYGSMDRAMLCLYQIISDGIHWHQLLVPLTPFASPWIQVCFVAYVAVTILAMMNVILGIFVDSVARTAEYSKKRTLIRSMQKLFIEADQDGSGDLDIEEFEAQMENPNMIEYLKEIDLDPRDARELFKLLDVEGTGSIDPDEWLNGCLTLTGPAKALDLATVLHEQRVLAKRWNAHADFVEDVLYAIEDQTLSQPTEARYTRARSSDLSPSQPVEPPYMNTRSSDLHPEFGALRSVSE